MKGRDALNCNSSAAVRIAAQLRPRVDHPSTDRTPAAVLPPTRRPPARPPHTYARGRQLQPLVRQRRTGTRGGSRLAPRYPSHEPGDSRKLSVWGRPSRGNAPVRSGEPLPLLAVPEALGHFRLHTGPSVEGAVPAAER